MYGTGTDRFVKKWKLVAALFSFIRLQKKVAGTIGADDAARLGITALPGGKAGIGFGAVGGFQ